MIGRIDKKNCLLCLHRMYDVLSEPTYVKKWAHRPQKSYSGGYRRILRLCRENNLMIHNKRHPNGITRADKEAQKAENLIKQDFFADTPTKNGSPTLPKFLAVMERSILRRF